MTNLFAKNRKYILKKLIDQDLHLGNQKEVVEKLILVDISNVNYWVKNNPAVKNPIDVLDNIENLPWPVVWFEYKSASMWDGELLDDTPALNVYKDLISGVLAIEDKEEINLLFFIGNGDVGIRCVGKFVYYKSIFKSFDMFIDSDWNGVDTKLHASTISTMLNPVLYSIIFSHCKNVEYADKSYSESLQKRNKERGKVPQETYKILDIEGLKKKIAAKSKGTEANGETALHVCRGHFREYTEDSPLFGHYTGKVWIPMHMRGKEENGKVNKDYKVNV